MELLANDKVTLHCGDCLEVMASLPENSVDSIVCDPPYHLTSIVKRFGGENAPLNKDYGKSGVYIRSAAGFMGKQWDGGDVAFRSDTWRAALRVLKPGGHLVAFSGTRTYHRMAVAIEDAGFEIRDQIGWAYGSGFPKSHDVSKGIDKHLFREWLDCDPARRVAFDKEIDKAKTSDKQKLVEDKWKAIGGFLRGKFRREATGRIGSVNTVGGDIKGDSRPWIEAAKERGYHETDDNTPVTDLGREWEGWGTALKPAWEPICLARKPLIGTVVETVLAHGTGGINIDACRVGDKIIGIEVDGLVLSATDKAGRFPANIVTDGSAEVVAAFPDSSGGAWPAQGAGFGMSGGERKQNGTRSEIGDSGSAARFFYSAKADSDDRLGSKHPTVKPVDLMQWLVRLVTPKGGTVLDCFAGTGTTGEAAFREGMRAVLIERESEYQNDIRRRMSLVLGGPQERKRESIKASGKSNADAGPLFA